MWYKSQSLSQWKLIIYSEEYHKRMLAHCFIEAMQHHFQLPNPQLSGTHTSFSYINNWGPIFDCYNMSMRMHYVMRGVWTLFLFYATYNKKDLIDMHRRCKIILHHQPIPTMFSATSPHFVPLS
jgi:hypothetical protein